ncbi:hypothetical protein PVAP13_2KG181574 [Panicum virgatum]|uniref:Uncharacterized protein n=1 Tax=Panicum virgatum TaxID=38727 RepID=A0A8T0W4N3_PANVG|nr:hypothetical protein PVAP13_2KG181574 [Panicum virgatum]
MAPAIAALHPHPPVVQILYLDALDICDIVDQTAKVRASVWTQSLVTRITAMDRVSSTEFGKLHLKAKYQMNSPNMLIQPERIDEFVNSNMPAESVTMDRNTFKQAINEFSLAINEAVVNLTLQLSQGGKQTPISTGAPARAQSTSAAAAEKQSSPTAAEDEDAEFKDKSDTPSEGDLEYVEESEDETIVNREHRSKRKQDVHVGKGH